MKLFTKALFTDLSTTAHESARGRSHHNIHEDLSDPVQRLCIALHRGTYIQPHRHTESYKWEMMFVLTGAIKMLIFDNKGIVTQQILLSEHGDTKGIEVPANTWHSLFPVTATALILEVKQGPFTETSPDNFAQWAPEEGDEKASSFLTWADTADIGHRYISD